MSTSDIPVIDISSSSPEIAKEVLEAASTHGFLFIKNDGATIPPRDIDHMFDLVSSSCSQVFGQTLFEFHSESTSLSDSFRPHNQINPLSLSTPPKQAA